MTDRLILAGETVKNSRMVQYSGRMSTSQSPLLAVPNITFAKDHSTNFVLFVTWCRWVWASICILKVASYSSHSGKSFQKDKLFGEYVVPNASHARINVCHSGQNVSDQCRVKPVSGVKCTVYGDCWSATLRWSCRSNPDWSSITYRNYSVRSVVLVDSLWCVWPWRVLVG